MKSFSTFFFLFFIGVLNAQYAGNGVFERIQFTTDLTDGYYVITAGTTKAMSNSYDGSYFSSVNISELNGVITNPPTSVVWKIETNGIYKTIKSENSSKFLSYTGTSNEIQFVENVTSNNQKWNITDNGSVFFITNVEDPANKFLSNYPEFSRWGCYPGTQILPRLYKLNSALSKSEFNKLPFTVYPNPAQDILFFQNENNTTFNNISIYDAFGKKVMINLENKSSINIQNLAEGIYFLNVISDEKTTQIKFIKN